MNAFVSPVPFPAFDAVAPEVYREFYGMPIYVTVPTADLERSVDFWVRGLGFIDLFTIPGRLIHLRRWAFQDVLLVTGEGADVPSAVSVAFAAVLGQLDEVAGRCEELVPGCTSGPVQQPWNSDELTVITPENARVILTAARPLDPDSAKAAELRELGIDVPASR
ncbi:VOC family protein [Kribbella amoyensis]|nr:VOC family protein [Kribbella amoyensis]